MAAHKLEKRLARGFGRLIQRGLLNAGPIVIHYIDKPSAAPPFDPNDESTYPAAPTQKTVTVNGFIHIVSARTTQRTFAEIKTGDAIVSFEPVMRDVNNTNNATNAVDLAAMEQIRFEINGDFYVQQAVGKELSQYWDVVIGGNPLSRTLLLRLMN